MSLFALVGLAACSGIEVYATQAAEADFSGFETYAWVEPASEKTGLPMYDGNDIVHEQIHRAFDQHLEARGLRRVEPDASPDYVFSHQLTVREKTDVQTYYDYGYIYGGSYRRVLVDVPTTTVRQYLEGTLIIDMVDPEGHHLVWRGWAQAEIDPQRRNPERSQARLELAASKMMAKFPIAAAAE